jgi:hypothetical protein
MISHCIPLHNIIYTTLPHDIPLITYPLSHYLPEVVATFWDDAPNPHHNLQWSWPGVALNQPRPFFNYASKRSLPLCFCFLKNKNKKDRYRKDYLFFDKDSCKNFLLANFVVIPCWVNFVVIHSPELSGHWDNPPRSFRIIPNHSGVCYRFARFSMIFHNIPIIPRINPH